MLGCLLLLVRPHTEVNVRLRIPKTSSSRYSDRQWDVDWVDLLYL